MRLKQLIKWLLLAAAAIVLLRMLMKKKLIYTGLVDFVKREEGKVMQGRFHIAYKDQVGVWTIGYGTTIINGKKVAAGDKIDETQAHALLGSRLNADRAKLVNDVPGLTANQYDALTSFVYNVGFGAYNSSTLRKLLKAGKVAEAAQQFSKWVYGTVNGTKVKLPGLVARREREKQLYEQS